MKRRIVLLFVNLLFFCWNGFSQNIIDKNSNHQIISEFSYFRSSTELLSTEIIGSKGWKESKPNATESLIIDKGYLYLQFIVDNRSHQKDFLFTVSNFEEAQYYDINNPAIGIKQIGQNIPMSQREINSGFRNYARAKISPNAIDTLYARINMNSNTINAQTFDFEISSQQKFTESQTVKLIIQSVLIGSLLIMCFFNLAIFFVVRDRNHLLYVITTFLIACVWVSSAGDGYLLQYLHPETPAFSIFENILITPLYAIFLIKFIQSYLKTKMYIPKWHYFLSMLGFAHVILAVARLFFVLPFEVAELLSGVLGLVILTTIFLITLYNLYHKIPQSKYFLYGNILFYPLAMYYMLSFSGLIPSSAFSWYAMEVGNVIEMMFFSMALGSNINMLKQEQVVLTCELKSTEETLTSLKKESNSFYFPQSAKLIKFEDIIMLESSDHYVLIQIKDKKQPLVERIKMSDLVQNFPPTLFVKVHRSYYVNMNHIASRPSKYLLKMSNDIEITVSRSCVDNLGDKFLVL